VQTHVDHTCLASLTYQLLHMLNKETFHVR